MSARRAAVVDNPGISRSDQTRLAPYVPRLLGDWLRYTPELLHRRIPGSAIFADISGFTELTERLAGRGKIGAEQMGDILNELFECVLEPAYDLGAGLVKWGGDAVLLFFEDELHAARAARAAIEMQNAVKRGGSIRTPSGVVRLQMSIGVHTGAFDFLLVGRSHRELVITGPGATVVTGLEKSADAGEILMSADTAEALTDAGEGVLHVARGGGLLLCKAPLVDLHPARAARVTGVDYRSVLPPSVWDCLVNGPVEPEHRQVAVGFVEFSGTDELVIGGRVEELVDAVDHVICSAQDAAAANKVTFLGSDVNSDGGKLILVAGVPRTLGDDETRILKAVRTVVDAGGALALRGGVNNGRVFAGDFGPSYRRTYSVVGDCVNLAARLMGKAAPGQVLAMGSVLDRSRSAFEAEPLEPFRVKGKRDDIQAFAVASPTAPVALGTSPITREYASDEKSGAFVGRESELEALLKAVSAIAGGQGAAVTLTGQPGIGKSRLVAEAVKRTDARVLWADGDVDGAATPYLPFQRLFRSRLRAERGAPGRPGDVDFLATRLEELVISAAPDLSPWLALIGVAAGVEFPWSPEITALEPPQRKERLEEATSAVLGALFTDPTVFVFNDVHLMDEASVTLLRRLATDAASRPWLIVLTCHSAISGALPEASHVRTIQLEPLSPVDSERLILGAAATTQLTPHRISALIERAAGNPLFLGALAAASTGLDDMETLPDTVEGVLAIRIDRLSPRERSLLRTASILGMTVDTSVLASMMGEDTIPDVGDESPLSEFVRKSDERHLQFLHHLVRQVAYEGLSYRRRAMLHGQAAAEIEKAAQNRLEAVADALSMHCLEAGRYDGAWRYSLIAGRRAREQFANAEAAACYERALRAARQVSPDSVELVEVFETLGDIRYDLGEFEFAETAFDRARRHAGDDPSRVTELLLKTATVRDSRGRYSDALRWLTKAERCATGSKSDPARQMAAQIVARRVRVRLNQGRHGEAARLARDALSSGVLKADLQSRAKVFELLDVCEIVLGRVKTESKAARALAIYERLGDVSGQARAHSFIGARAFYLGEWVDALEHYAAAEAAYERVGRRWDAITGLANQAEVFIHQGRLDQARPMLERAMVVWRSVKADPEIAFGNWLLGRLAALAGDFDEAFDRLELARRHCADANETTEALIVETYTAEALLLSGRVAEALVHAEGTIARSDKIAPNGSDLPMLYRVRGLALEAMGESEGARASFERSLRIARERRAAHEVAFTLRVLLTGVDEGTFDAAPRTLGRWRDEYNDLAATLGLLGATGGTS